MGSIAQFIAIYVTKNYINTGDYNLDIFIQSLLISMITSLLAYLTAQNIDIGIIIYWYKKYIKKEDQSFNFNKLLSSEDEFKRLKHNIKIFGHEILLYDDVNKKVNDYFKNRINESYKAYFYMYQYNYNKYVYCSAVYDYNSDGTGNFIISSIEYACDSAEDLLEFTKKYRKNTVKNTEKEIAGMSSSNSCSVVPYIGNINRNKNINKMVFQDKDKLLYKLDQFKQNMNKQLFNDNKFMILLYGPPGTGKTCLITAIANYLSFGILKYDFKICNNKKSFSTAVKYCKDNNYILYLDEIDYILDNLKLSQENLKTLTSELKSSTNENIKQNLSKINDNINNVIDNEVLLDALDGIFSTHNLVVIATTNHPNKITPALKRNFRLKPFPMSYFNKELIIQYIEMNYDTNDDFNYIDNDIVVAPVDLITHAMEYENYDEFKQNWAIFVEIATENIKNNINY
jgi:hypothetical protein